MNPDTLNYLRDSARNSIQRRYNSGLNEAVNPTASSIIRNQLNPSFNSSMSNFNYSLQPPTRTRYRTRYRTRDLGSGYSNAVRRLVRSLNSFTTQARTARDKIRKLGTRFTSLGSPLSQLKDAVRKVRDSSNKYHNSIDSLTSVVKDAKESLRSHDPIKSGKSANEVESQSQAVNTGRQHLATVVRTPSNNDSYGKELERGLSATVPAMSLTEYIQNALNKHNISSDSNSDRANYVRGQAHLRYMKYNLGNPTRGLVNAMRATLRPYQVGRSRGRMTQRSVSSAQTRYNNAFGKNGIYPYVSRIMQKSLSNLNNRRDDQQSALSRESSQLRANPNILSDDNGNFSANKNASSTDKEALHKYAQNTVELSNLNAEIARLTDELSTVQSGISNTQSRYHSYNRHMSTNPLTLGNKNITTVRPDEGTAKGAIFDVLRGMAKSAIPAMVAAVHSNNESGNQIRVQMGPDVLGQVQGSAINGNNNVPERQDNNIERQFTRSDYQLGETPQQMAGNLNSLAGTRDTNNEDMTRAAINEGRFERADNISSSVAQSLFSTLGQAGGLGSRGNQVNSNLSSLSAQFTGMLNQDHLGAMGNQQAQGLNSIFSGMLSSGQTVTPNTAGNIMAMQSELSHGPGGQVFQGQQGAQQLSAFSHGVAGSFNNQLVRNAFAGGMPQYGGQQGLYRLQMDMEEPLKHPTQLNNMIQGISNIAGPSGAEDELTQMGLGPEAAKKIYREAMSGNLTQGSLDRVKRRDRNKGRSAENRSLRAYNRSGTKTVEELQSIRTNVKAITSMMFDYGRRMSNDIEGPMSHSDIGALGDTALPLLGGGLGTGLTTGLSLLGNYSIMHGGVLGHLARIGSDGKEIHPFMHPVQAARYTYRGLKAEPARLKAYYRGFLKNGPKGVRDAYDNINDIGKDTSKGVKVAKSGSLLNYGRRAVHGLRSIVPSAIRKRIPHLNGPLAQHVANGARHLTRYVPKVGKLAETVGKHPGLVRGAKGLGHFAGRALDYAAPAAGIWTGMHYLRRGHPIRAVSGGLDAALSNSDVGLGADILGGGAKMLGMHKIGNAIEDAGNSPLHSIGKLLGFDNHKKASASSFNGRKRLDYANYNNHKHYRHTTYYWLTRINRLLPALAKKMSGFSDVDPSLAGNKTDSEESKESGTGNGTNSKTYNSSDNPTLGTSTTPIGPSPTGAKSYNGTGNRGVQTNAATIQPAQISSNYFDATLGSNTTNDDHSNHTDSHNIYKNYITSPSENFLDKVANISRKSAQYFGHTHRTEWA